MIEHLYNTLNLFIVLILSITIVMGPFGISMLLEEKGYKKISWAIGGGWLLFLIFLECFIIAK